jgi:NitT/TauT family transport system substrate-binding protein
MQRRHLLQNAAALALPLSGGLLGCSARPAPLVVSAHPWIGYEPLFYARHLGQLPESKVRLSEAPDASGSMHKLAAGLADAAALTLDEVLRVREMGLALQVVLVFDVSRGADAVVVKPHIKHTLDLAGKTIAVENTALGALMLAECLRMHGIRADQVRIKSVGFDEHESVWLDPGVDALVTYQPVVWKLVQRGGRVLFDSSLIPGRIVDVLAVTPQVMENRVSDVRELLSTYFNTQKAMRAQTAKAAAWYESRLGLSGSDLAAVQEGLVVPDLVNNRRMLGTASGSLYENAASLGQFMVAHGLLKNRPKLGDLFTADALPPVAE